MKGNKAFVNEFHLNSAVLNMIEKNDSPVTESHSLPIYDLSFHLADLLSAHEVINLNHDINQEKWIPVGVDGIQSHYKDGDTIGSYRLSCYEEKLANSLFERMKPYLPTVRVMNEDSPTDWNGHKLWEPIGLNPLFRLIRYTKEGLLIPHYDAPFIQNEEIRSLSTVVIYLTDNVDGGDTRFLKDSQTMLPLHERNYDDWTREAFDDEVEFKVKPSKGDALIFDHRVLHDSEKIKNDELKTIIRTDIMYRRV